MTNKELSQLYWLNREICTDKQKLAELKSAATSTALKVTGLPHVTRTSDKTAIGTDIAYLEKVIQFKIDRTVAEYERITIYINNIDDSLVRQVMSLRHINGLSWKQVAARIGGGNTEESVRKIHDRFLNSH